MQKFISDTIKLNGSEILQNIMYSNNPYSIS